MPAPGWRPPASIDVGLPDVDGSETTAREYRTIPATPTCSEKNHDRSTPAFIPTFDPCSCVVVALVSCTSSYGYSSAISTFCTICCVTLKYVGPPNKAT